jgi:hypothetical protein
LGFRGFIKKPDSRRHGQESSKQLGALQSPTWNSRLVNRVKRQFTIDPNSQYDSGHYLSNFIGNSWHKKISVENCVQVTMGSVQSPDQKNSLKSS